MNIHSIKLSQLTGIKNFATNYSQLDDDFILSRMTLGVDSQTNSYRSPQHPVRIDGFTLVLCLKGSFTVGINLDDIEVKSNSVLIAGPNNIIRVYDAVEDADAYVLFISLDFMKDINLDINVMNVNRLPRQRTPWHELNENEANILRKYLDLIHLNATQNTVPIYTRNIARCLMASLMYQLMQFATNRAESKINESEEERQPQSRRMNYVRDFMALVQKYHCKERSVGFYAGKLYISPKYLSLIIKESTGRSAAEWIDEYVILEAKNLLRFSGKNIQQVAYELNFTNQSSFGKYFKHLTGMSPSEFQRS